MSTNYVVEPYPISKLSSDPSVIDAVFGSFERTVSQVLEAHRSSRSKSARTVVRFFEHLIETVDAKEHREIQRRFLAPEVTVILKDRVKYIDPVRWFVSKLRTAKEQLLVGRPRLDILDLGVGPGHFPAVANYLGHSAMGLDLPQQPVKFAREFYDSLCQLYGVEQIYARISRTAPFPDVPKRYDLVTAYLVAFSADDRGLWGPLEWETLLQQLADKVLKPRGDLSLVLTRGKVTEDVLRWLSERATKFDGESLRIDFRNLGQCLASAPRKAQSGTPPG